MHVYVCVSVVSEVYGESQLGTSVVQAYHRTPVGTDQGT